MVEKWSVLLRTVTCSKPTPQHNNNMLVGTMRAGNGEAATLSFHLLLMGRLLCDMAFSSLTSPTTAS